MKRAILLLAALAAAPALAEDAPCIGPAAVPGFAGWGRAAGDRLAIGSEAMLALAPDGSTRFAPPSARAPKPGGRGGAFELAVPAAGTYRIALSDKAWVDVVQGGRRVSSVAHEHGAVCSGIAKIVAFRLAAGSATLQISEAERPAIGVMVVKN